MNTPKKTSGMTAIFWWVIWIFTTIATFFVSCYFWTGFIAEKVGPMSQSGVPLIWVATVFGTWMVFLVPLIIVMYSKVDKAYEDARIRREEAASQRESEKALCRSILVEPSERVLSKELRQQLKRIPEIVRKGQVVTCVLKDGRKVENVFILNRKELMGVYGVQTLSFSSSDIVEMEPMNLEALPDYRQEYWLRLDGIGGNNG